MKGKTRIITKFHRTDFIIRPRCREGNIQMVLCDLIFSVAQDARHVLSQAY